MLTADRYTFEIIQSDNPHDLYDLGLNASLINSFFVDISKVQKEHLREDGIRRSQNSRVNPYLEY
jgi:hypothetical protein